MTDPLPPAASSSPTAAAQRVTTGPASSAAAAPPPARTAGSRGVWVLIACAVLLALIGLGLALKADQRVRNVEQTLVKRQQETAGQSTEARMLAKQAQENALEVAAKTALLEARVAEFAVQRSQLEELMQSLSRSRDENLVIDVESSIRAAVQQSVMTGSAEPLVAALRQGEERIARFNQPRLEGVRRAIARDLERVKAASVADTSSLSLRLDEAIRMVDDLPLLSAPLPRGHDRVSGGPDGDRPVAAPDPAASAAASAPSASAWVRSAQDAIERVLARVWEEAKSLIRVTRIDQPEAALMSPEQAFFVRENVKLRLLSARVAVLSRQFDTAQHDLAVAQSFLARYFDAGARRTVVATDLVRQIAEQARQGGVPRPEETLAALAAAEAGR